MSLDDQPPLFDSPAPEPRWVSPRKPSTKVRYSRFRSQGRTLCDDCIADIHARGQEGAPYPGRALWRRVASGEPRVLLLCGRHKDERSGHDGG